MLPSLPYIGYFWEDRPANLLYVNLGVYVQEVWWKPIFTSISSDSWGWFKLIIPCHLGFTIYLIWSKDERFQVRGNTDICNSIFSHGRWPNKRKEKWIFSLCNNSVGGRPLFSEALMYAETWKPLDHGLLGLQHQKGKIGTVRVKVKEENPASLSMLLPLDFTHSHSEWATHFSDHLSMTVMRERMPLVITCFVSVHIKKCWIKPLFFTQFWTISNWNIFLPSWRADWTS